MSLWDYQAKVERVVDGDTVRFLFDNGMYIRSSQSIRLAGVDAPELSEPGGQDAREFVHEWVVAHIRCAIVDGALWPFRVVTEKDRQTFNRYIGVVSCGSCGAVLNDDVNAHLAL